MAGGAGWAGAPAALLRSVRRLREVFEVCGRDPDGFLRVERVAALGLRFGQGEEVRSWLARASPCWGRGNRGDPVLCSHPRGAWCVTWHPPPRWPAWPPPALPSRPSPIPGALTSSPWTPPPTHIQSQGYVRPAPGLGGTGTGPQLHLPNLEQEMAAWGPPWSLVQVLVTSHSSWMGRPDWPRAVLAAAGQDQAEQW